MLAWVDDPTATQLLLSIGCRFRTKSFQNEATRQVEALAEREGWTVDELADRTIPTAGFDAAGRLELSYGAAHVHRAAAAGPDHRAARPRTEPSIKSLPAARQSDDPEQVKAAKAALTAATQGPQDDRRGAGAPPLRGHVHGSGRGRPRTGGSTSPGTR